MRILLSILAPVVCLAQSSYTYYLTGSSADVQRTTGGGAMLMGGGTDVDDAFRWFIGKSGGGDIVVIRASGSDGYNPYIMSLGTVDSVESIVFRTKSASSDSFVLDKIRKAEGLFLAGGDQADYVRLWKDTPVEDAIRELVGRGVPVGGTSAGLAVLGQFFFSAEKGTVDSDEALRNPYNFRMTLGRDFLDVPELASVITDSHFGQRDRLGRLVTFLARLMQDRWSMSPRGIGIDEQTAVLVEPGGAASIVGVGQAWFLKPTVNPTVCQSRTPLTFTGVQLYRVRKTGSFDVASWTGAGGTAETVNVNNGVLTRQ
ncbi:MAG: cyanophycinase [Bryobacteraceae bacterium]|nr:cyanophycinase [Bryobacteraceae bacterium]